MSLGVPARPRMRPARSAPRAPGRASLHALMSRRHALSLSLPGVRGRRYVAKSSMYLLPMCVLFFCIARCASAGEANVTHASPVARPSLCPRTMPVIGWKAENPQLWGGGEAGS